MGGWEYVLEFLCCFFALSDDDGWEKTTHELMVLYGDDEMVMPFNTQTHTNVSNYLCNGLSLSLSSSCSLVDPLVFLVARYKSERGKGLLCNTSTTVGGGKGAGGWGRGTRG